MGNGRRVVKLNEASLRRLVRRMLRETTWASDEGLRGEKGMPTAYGPRLGHGSADPRRKMMDNVLSVLVNLNRDQQEKMLAAMDGDLVKELRAELGI